MGRHGIRPAVRRLLTAGLAGLMAMTGVTVTASSASAHTRDQVLKYGCDVPTGKPAGTHREVDRVAVRTSGGTRYGVTFLARAGNSHCVVTSIIGNHHDNRKNWVEAYLNPPGPSEPARRDRGSYYHFANVVTTTRSACVIFSGTIWHGPRSGDGPKASGSKTYCR